MPRIFDNIQTELLPALRNSLVAGHRADFSVGYVNLRGWKRVADLVERWPGGDGHQCRLLVGMQRAPEEDLREALGIATSGSQIDNRRAASAKARLAADLREQLIVGLPTDADEAGLRMLAKQLRARKVVVRLFLRHPLHAKLYLAFRSDPDNPVVGYVGSSNLTLSGLSSQGELNVDVLDHDAADKLAQWFEDRWQDRWCVDVTDALIQVIEESWARPDPIPPYHIYIKMAYHLAQEARTGLAEFRIPREFGDRLLDYQVAAVKIAAHHLNKRGGVLIGDVVGLGKTLMATAVAKIMQEDQFTETLIICPKNLQPMWQIYVDRYRLLARVMSISQTTRQLGALRRYRVVLIDESHNLRNREGRRYRAIRDYIDHNGAQCILLTATPYNKTYLDLSSQLRLFVPEDRDLGIRPERLLRQIGEQGLSRYQCAPRTIAAFEHSEHADDWRDLMRLYLVRRTRTFIIDNYAQTDQVTGRKFVLLEGGNRSFFPERVPSTVRFAVDDTDAADQFARLYADDVVDTIAGLRLPRYGLGNYVSPAASQSARSPEKEQLEALARAGKRLMGFCRTNLFKRLESSGAAFLQSIERHILRNHVYLHAIKNGLDVPIGTLDASLLDPGVEDADEDSHEEDENSGGEGDEPTDGDNATPALRTEAHFEEEGARLYNLYAGQLRSRYRWLPGRLFTAALEQDLRDDASALIDLLGRCGDWDAAKDSKLAALRKLVEQTHPDEKVIVFTQFADTVNYLSRQLARKQLAGVTGRTLDPTAMAKRFSPVSNEARQEVSPDQELRVLIATDVLSEGQNLQDGAIVVNYDLPWAIIRLIQRAGRVDRIGQTAERILCYSFLPADGVERIIRLRGRVRERLRQNAEVLGTDEAFFEDEEEKRTLQDLYSEKAGIMDGEPDTEVDLASFAYQIWKNAIDRDPSLEKVIPALPSVVYSARHHQPEPGRPAGALVYARTPQGNDALAWTDSNGASVTESQFEILRAARCEPDTAAVPRAANHHKLVAQAVAHIAAEETSVGGHLGRPSGARYRTYERLKRFAQEARGTLLEVPGLAEAIEEVYRHPLRESAVNALNRQLRSAATDEQLAELVVALREEGRLCTVQEREVSTDAQIICSLGLTEAAAGPEMSQ
ncbi:MAG TPA: helicase-related protein [Chthonomonadales bacterium]|nr:helicase-related protein [Chthonomonadales bacterium]